MALITFIIPTDKDILKDLKEEPRAIKFVGSATFSQNLESIKFYRTFVNRFDKSNRRKQVVYQRKGLIWKFIEVKESVELIN